jgi:YfiH family protein
MERDTLWLHADGWQGSPALIHGFSGRLSDRASALSHLSSQELPVYTLEQVHGNEIRIVTRTSCWTEDARPHADGIMTAEAGKLLGIVTADCVPALMVAPQHGIVVAVHAGWRGTDKAICTRAIHKLKTNWGVLPEQLWVAFGPAIGGCCYEVSQNIGEALCRKWGERGERAWQPYGEKGLLDLRLVNRLECEETGIPPDQIQNVGPCTFCAKDEFFSYRRQGQQTGRQLSVIGWRNQV